jgi:hypothetical protein
MFLLGVCVEVVNYINATFDFDFALSLSIYCCNKEGYIVTMIELMVNHPRPKEDDWKD